MKSVGQSDHIIRLKRLEKTSYFFTQISFLWDDISYHIVKKIVFSLPAFKSIFFKKENGRYSVFSLGLVGLC
jgi:hypothetical protein